MKCEVKWLDSKIKEKFLKLDSKLMNQIVKALDRIEHNHCCGIYIPKRLIPSKWDVRNLCKLNLTGGWRLIYTITSDQRKIIVYILDFMNHKQYCRLFNY